MMKKTMLVWFLSVGIFSLLAFGQDNISLYRQNGERALRAFAADETARKSAPRRDVHPVEQPTPLPTIELTPAATGPDVVITYLGALNSLVGLVDQIGNRRASGLAFLYRAVNSPALEIVNLPSNGNLLVSLAGGRLLRLEKSLYSGFFSIGSVISFAGIADGDALMFDFGSGDFPVLANSNSTAIYRYAIRDGRISIGPESGLPHLTAGGLVSFARDSRGNLYVIDLSDGGLIWRIPAIGLQTAWDRAVLFATVPRATSLAIDPANDDLYISAAGTGLAVPPTVQVTEDGGIMPSGHSRILVFKNVLTNGNRNALIFAEGTPLFVDYSPTGGLAAANGHVYVVSQRIATGPFGMQFIPEILFYEAGLEGTAVSISAYLPAELNTNIALISGLAVLR